MEKITDTKQIAKLVREQLKKEFPKYKFSVTKDGHSSLNVHLMLAENHFQISEYSFKDPWKEDVWNNGCFLTEEAHKVLTRAVEIINQWNWDNSGSMTDYFDVNYYVHLCIGKWDKGFEVIN